jgi:antitoxin component of MazEF toxin-antitoxin module
MATKKLLKWGNSVGLLIPDLAVRQCGLRAGSLVRIVVLEDEIRVRRFTAPPRDELAPYDEHPDGRPATEREEVKW